MKKLILIVLGLLYVLPLYAGQYHAIIYCNKRNPEIAGDIREHWKPDIPDVGADEVIRDFKVLERQGEKFVVHALVDTASGVDGQVGRIKDHIRIVNGCTAPTLQGPTCTTPVAQQLLAWWDKDADQMYTKMWQDRTTHSVFETIAKGVMRYPVETTCGGEPCTLIVSVTEAEDTYLETIDPQKIMVPHRFYGK